MRMATRLLILLPLLLLAFGCQNQPSPVELGEPAGPEQANFTTLPQGAVLVSATLYVNIVSPSNELVNIHRITEDWDEYEVTWNNFGAAFAPAVDGSFTASGLGWKSADVTGLVDGWLMGDYENFGLLMEQPAPSFPRTRYHSREADEGHPYIELCYTLDDSLVCEDIVAFADNFIWETTPDANYGDLDRLWTGRPSANDLEKQALIRFDITSAPPEEEAALGDRVWLDEDMNGVQDPGEDGVPNVIVKLYDCAGNFIASMTTDDQGYYLFEHLDPGDYYVEFVLPNGYVFTSQDQGGDDGADSDADPDTGMTICVTLTADDVDLRWDAGIYPEIQEDCLDCEGGVIQLSLEYMGDEAVEIFVYEGKDEKDDKILYSGVVNPGDQFTFEGIKDDGTMGSEISIWIGGERHVKIHTSCSKPIGPGLLAGDFLVVGGYSKDGGLLCPINDGCAECDGKIIRLTLENMGEAGDLTVYEGDNDDQNKILFHGFVGAGEEFTFNGIKDDGTMGSEISVWMGDQRLVEIHTSCSQPIGPGMIFGAFKVIEGWSRYGGLLCDIADGGCQECEGKVTQLTLRNDGPAALVQIYEGDEDRPDKLLFGEFVMEGVEFTFTGIRDDLTMSSKITVWLDGNFHVEIHTSCSQPIGPGQTHGNFFIVEGYSKDGGLLCPVDDQPDDPDNNGLCEIGKPMILTMSYNGGGCDSTQHSQDDGKVRCEGDAGVADPVWIVSAKDEDYDDNDIFFMGEVPLGGSFDIDANNIGRDKLKSKTFVFIYDAEDGELLQFIEFHTSCSQPLFLGDRFGSLILEDFIPEQD